MPVVKGFVLPVVMLVLGAMMGFLTSAPLVWGHGGEDHGDTPQETAVATGTTNAVMAKVGKLEVLLKYGELLPGKESVLRIFITDFASNAPIADIRGVIAFSGGSFKTATPENLLNAADTPGMYETAMTFPKAGQYTAILRLSDAQGERQVKLAGIVVK